MKMTPPSGDPSHSSASSVEYKRHTANKRLRSIDRINDPTIRTAAGLFLELFALQRVIGKPLSEQLPRQLLGFAVGDRDGRIILLASTTRASAAKVLQRVSAGGLGDFDHGGQTTVVKRLPGIG